MSRPTRFSCCVAEVDPLQRCSKITAVGEGEAGMSLPEECKPAGKWLNYDGKKHPFHSAHALS